MRTLLDAVVEPICSGLFILFLFLWPALLPGQKELRDRLRGKR